MSDFHQHGLVPTLHRVGERDLASMDRELAGFAAARPAAILIPCHGPDLGSPAFDGILAALRGLRFPGAVVVGVNGAAPAAVAELERRLAGFPCRTAVLVCDSEAVLGQLRAPEFARLGAPSPGKGLNLWLAAGFAASRAGAEVCIAHDADIASYTPDLPLRLAFPVLHPELGYVFAKGYYHRASERLHGRVTRLLFVPLIDALLRVAGHQPLLDFVAGFRYPLAGEFAMSAEISGLLRTGNGYALETVQLCEVHRVAEPERVCQVDIGPNYEHRHHAFDPGAGDSKLDAMAREIAGALLVELGAEGVALAPDGGSGLREEYLRTGRAFALRYAHVARINGLAPVVDEELAMVARFAAGIVAGAEAPRLLPAWATVGRLLPGFCERLLDAALERSA